MAKFSLLIVASTLLSFCLAQTTTTSSAPAATTSATIYAGNSDYTYYGCYNETTLLNGTSGLRALNGGSDEALDAMTVPVCLNYCKSGGYMYAGLEYTRECYCAPLLSGVSAELSASSCNLPCEGNSSQICGGNLHLSVYQAKTTTKAAGIRGVRDAPLESILALGIAMGVLLCLA